MGKKVSVKSYAKINLALDAGTVMENGMHPVDTVMQQISLCDLVEIELKDRSCRDAGIGEPIPGIVISCNQDNVPTDENNLAYKGARVFLEHYWEKYLDNHGGDGTWDNNSFDIYINIEKNIPVEAGLAGGSGNAAAVLQGLNILLGTGLGMEELCLMGAELGSDVPFCIGGQAAANDVIPENVKCHELASSAARGTGTGTSLSPVKSIDYWVLIAKPKKGISTAEVYRGIDNVDINERPDCNKLVYAINAGEEDIALSQMINVLENYTLMVRPDVKELKEKMKNLAGCCKALMSGSGPTVFALFRNEQSARRALSDMDGLEYEVNLCHTNP